MFAPRPDQKTLIDAIRDQTDGVPNHLVFVLDIVSVRFGGYFTPLIKAQIEKFPYLQMLTLNDCAIKSLDNFPHLPGLIRLDLVFNEITGESLHNIKGSRHLQTLMLGANKIQKFQHLQPLVGMRQLLQLDLINNPINKEAGYRQKIFDMFPSITILDTLDKGGKDAYTNPSMVQAVSRVPDALFDKSPQVPMSGGFGMPPPPVPAPLFGSSSHAPTKSLAVPPFGGKAPIRKIKKSATSKKSKRDIGGKVQPSKSTTSRRAGIIFPAARIKRRYKEAIPTVRVGKTCSIYTAAVLEYLSAELLQIAGNEAKKEKKQRITPAILKRCLMSDQQMHRFLNSVTFGMGQ